MNLNDLISWLNRIYSNRNCDQLDEILMIDSRTAFGTAQATYEGINAIEDIQITIKNTGYQDPVDGTPDPNDWNGFSLEREPS